MELFHYFRVHGRYWRLSVVSFLAILAVGYTWAYTRPSRFQTSVALVVRQSQSQPTEDYQFDGYYALQSADIFAQTVVSMLQAPSVVVEIYERAGMATQPRSWRSLSDRFKAKKQSAQNILVSYTTPSAEEATKLADALTGVLTSRITSLNSAANSKSVFQLESSRPVTVESKPQPVVIGLAASIVWAAIILVLIPVIDSQRRQNINPRP